jgi:hypothetical protein
MMRTFFFKRSSRREEALTSQSAIRKPQSEIDQSLLTSAATGLLEGILGRRALVFRKYKVAPRLGTATVRRRLLEGLGVTCSRFSNNLDTATQV